MKAIFALSLISTLMGVQAFAAAGQFISCAVTENYVDSHGGKAQTTKSYRLQVSGHGTDVETPNTPDLTVSFIPAYGDIAGARMLQMFASVTDKRTGGQSGGLVLASPDSTSKNLSLDLVYFGVGQEGVAIECSPAN